MKRKYLTPETIQVTLYGKVVMGAASPTTTGRVADGDPTENGLTPGINDYTGAEGQDPFGGRGQGTGGEGNRAKEMDVWAWDW